ncbi:MAG: hypothetical protein P0S94_04195 [Simkaniaceae bacterium]|nr:hypothetical protein [Simkaniaceae bacterium]
MDGKKYSKLESSPLTITPVPQDEGKAKRIIPSAVKNDLRETFKRTFLPLLIDIFELRQMVSTYKVKRENPHLSSLENPNRSPEEVLKRLEEMQNDVEETLRWCDGVITQISKGINEAKEALEE